MSQKILGLAVLLLMLLLGLACSGGSESVADSTSTRSSSLTNTPETTSTLAPQGTRPYASFADELELALASGDASWFVDNMTDRFSCSFFTESLPECRTAPPETRVSTVEVQAWRGETNVLGEVEFSDALEELFGTVDASAEDEYGTGALRLYAIGDQQLPAGLLIVHLMATAILDGPAHGRWAFVWTAERKPLEPGQWELRRMLSVPPERVDDALAFQPLGDLSADPSVYPAGFADALAAIEQAVETSDSAALASLIAFSPFACPEAPGITAVPSCFGQPPGTSIDAVYWQVYCNACDPHGFATEQELLVWLDELFSGAVGSQADWFGPAKFEVALVAGAPLRSFLPGVQPAGTSSFGVTISGVTEVDLIGGGPRPPGRWLVTLTVREIGGEWRIDALTTGEPGISEWMLPTLLGTNIIWTARTPVN